MEELTMEDLEGCQIGRSLRGGQLSPTNQVCFSTSKKKKRDILLRNQPLSVSQRCCSTALCVAHRSVVFALLLSLCLICWAVLVAVGTTGGLGCC